MKTPIYDFIQTYITSTPHRLHMPGHKGTPFLGCEPYDLTEIDGADNLYDPQSIIMESEQNATELFGSGATLYSTGGSSQSVRAMVHLAALSKPGPLKLIAGRNAHKSFLTAAALLDADIRWLYPEGPGYSLCRCDISPDGLKRALMDCPEAAAVYVTSPDYLGNTLDVAALAAVAHSHGVPLLVDNAHGAYLRFLPEPCHPMDLGADLCCDSAHKTLPVLTGGGYLHVSRDAPALFRERAREAMALFGSTSPSYLILQSLDLCNQYLASSYPENLDYTVGFLSELRGFLAGEGWRFIGDEPLKLTLDSRPMGFTGQEISRHLVSHGIHPEYADPDYLVLMPAPETPPESLELLLSALSALAPRPPLAGPALELSPPPRAMTLRQALFSPTEVLPLEAAAGRVLAGLSASCPPAVAPAVPGEVLTGNVIDIYRYYGIERVSVVKE